MHERGEPWRDEDWTETRHKVTEIECRPKGDESWVYEIVEF
jgi:hypothetical protein